MGWASFMIPVFIEFVSTNIQENNRLNEIYSTIASEFARISQQNTTINQAKSMFANSENYKSFRDELLQNFYWKADDYKIVAYYYI